MLIAVAGKGGTGKTTIAALIVRRLLQRGTTPVLAVDADPNSNLGDKLGLHIRRTIGELREDAVKHKHTAPAGTPKQRAVEYEVQDAIAEGAGFDLLAMGRGEGPDCYCAVNNMLRAFLHKLAAGYPFVVVDNEAGMEHLSRRTDDRVDLMLVVGDPTPTGLKSAERIGRLAAQMGVVRGRMGLVVNRIAGAPAGPEAAAATGLPLMGWIPEDPLVAEFERRSQPLLTLPAASAAAAAVDALLRDLGV